MKNIFFLLVFNWLTAAAQPPASYRWVQISGANYVRETKYALPIGVDSTITISYKFYADTVQLRSVVTETMLQKRAQADELAAESNRLALEADSLYFVLVDLNDGYGSIDDVPPLKVPTNPAEEYKQMRWGAILRDDEINVG